MADLRRGLNGYLKEMQREETEMTEEKFEAIYREHYKTVLQYVRGRVTEEAAEDLTQEVFFTAWKKREKVEASHNPAGWLINAAKYKIKEFRRDDAHAWTFFDAEAYGLAEKDPAYEMVEWAMLLEDYLNDGGFQLYLEHFFLGRSVGELARREGVKETLLRMRLCRLRKKIIDDFYMSRI